MIEYHIMDTADEHIKKPVPKWFLFEYRLLVVMCDTRFR